MKTIAFDQVFLEFIPAVLDSHRLYVSMEYATMSHLCACGCGQRVVTPLGPTDWRITYDGESITLWPSVGNWSFDCQSHYVIRRGRVEWAPRWTRDRIDRGRKLDEAATADHGPGSPETDGGNGRPDLAIRLRDHAVTFGRRLRTRRVRGSR